MNTNVFSSRVNDTVFVARKLISLFVELDILFAMLHFALRITNEANQNVKQWLRA